MSKQLKLGEFISILEQIPGDINILLPFNYIPDGLGSYRGYYDDLALEYTTYEKRNGCKVAELLKWAKNCINETRRGYKGGGILDDGKDTVVGGKLW